MNAFRTKIALGYALIALLMGGIIFIWLGEWRDVELQEKEYRQINRLRGEVHDIHVQLIELSLLGETVLEWDSVDTEFYHAKRLALDTLLCHFTELYPAEQIDSVRILLAAKEEHLNSIMRLFDRQENVNRQIARQVPVIAATSEQKPSKKRSGFLGLFGKKKDTQQSNTSAMLYRLNDKMIATQQLQQEQLAGYADSLAQRNTQLNIQLQELITRIDGKVRSDLQKRDATLHSMQERSYRLIGMMTVVMALLLVGLYLIIHRNMKRKEQIQRELEKSVDDYNHLLNLRKKIILTLSHDIRGPLGTIYGCAELAEKTDDAKSRKTQLKNIRIHSKHIQHLLNNLLDMYRLNENKECINAVPFRLSAMFDHIVSSVSPIVRNKGLLFNHHFDNTEVVVKGDMDRIEQIIDNLLTNAVKFTQAGAIGLDAGYSDGVLNMTVSDTGIGMEKAMMERIFIPFERSTDCSKVEGFGLGLPITRELVRAMGGKIEVESTVGKGTEFRVTLPLPLTDEAVREETDMPESVLCLPKKVIAIDDAPTQLVVIKGLLEHQGISCTTCNNVAKLTYKLDKGEYDILLSDIQMPEMNGFELLALLRSSNIRKLNEIPVIAVTAKGGEYDREYFLEKGFSGCLFKPFTSMELLQAISSVMHGVQENRPVDFTPLLSEVTNVRDVLAGVVEECRINLSALECSLKTDDREAMGKTVHRMMPLWEMAGRSGLLKAYRELLKGTDAYKDSIAAHTKNVMKELEKWIADAGKEMERRRT